MAAALGGLEYESKVRSAVETASTKNKNIELLPDATAGFNANEVDLKLRSRVRFGILRLNLAQMIRWVVPL